MSFMLAEDHSLTGLLLDHWPIPAPSGRLQALREQMARLARDGRALDLRLARLLAWIKSQDLGELGYTSYTAFCRERVEWRISWLRSLVRLAQSPLGLVKRAVCEGIISMDTATRAAGHVEPEDQEAWLALAIQGKLPRRNTQPVAEANEDKEWLDIQGADAATVHKARELARLVLGWAAPNRVADAYIIGCWQNGPPREAILRKARETPPVPDEPSPGWCREADPASALVGPWQQPQNLPDAVDQLEELQALRRGRIIALGLAYESVVYNRLHLDLGYETLADFTKAELGMSVRSLERYRKLGETLGLHPEFEAATRQGLSLDKAEAIGGIVHEGSVVDWIAIARRVGMTELGRAITTTETVSPHKVVTAYQQALDNTPEDLATATVALASHRPSPTPRGMWVWQGLVEASQWFLDNVRVPRPVGFASIKTRDSYRCQNPECGRRNLRVEAHHIVFRSEGGSDDPDNGITLCRVCHLRLVHTGIVSVKRQGELLVWRYPGRQVVVSAPFRQTAVNSPSVNCQEVSIT